jgi:recombination protein RecR
MLASTILAVKSQIHLCSACNNLTDVDPCRICSNPDRDGRLICVVETPFNINSIEKTGEYHGLYHVLHGSISPVQGIGPEELKMDKLMARLQEGKISEVIIATNPNMEGETTALYLAKLIKPLGIRVTRIAMGLPVGSDLEFADQVTMTRSLAGRHEM